MKRALSMLGAATLLGATLAPAVHAHGLARHQRASVFRVGLVTDTGGLNDRSFNHLAYVGLQRAQSTYHARGSVIQSHSQGDYVPFMTTFAQRHYNLVVAVGFLMENAVYQVAKQFPHTHFALIDGAPSDAKGNVHNLPNVANLFFKEQESGYLVGVIAGIMERNKVGAATHNTIGVMGGVSIPPVNRYIAGYYQGARQVNPHIRIIRGYSQSFTDQTAGKNIGLSQISQGADVLFQVAGSSGLGYLAAAQQRGKYGIGVDADQGYLGRYVITSALKKVDVAVAQTIHDTMIGRFRGGDHEFDLKNNATGFAKTSSVVPAYALATARTYARLIKSGKIVPSTLIPQS